MKTATKPAFGWRGRDRIITVILSLIPPVVVAGEPRFTRPTPRVALDFAGFTGQTGR